MRKDVEVPATDTGTEPATAADRLALSRSALRGAMMDIAHPPKRPGFAASGGRGFAQTLFGRAKTLPGAAIVIEGLREWWQHHPARTAGALAEQASLALVQPLVKKNPQWFIAGAAVAGALFALTRPWRWLVRPALLFGFLPQIASRVLRRMPLESWLSLVSSAAGAGRRRSSRATATATDPARASHLP